MRVNIQPYSRRSRATGKAGKEIRERDRVVGIERACMAELQENMSKQIEQLGRTGTFRTEIFAN
jgi:hypothetical protein